MPDRFLASAWLCSRHSVQHFYMRQVLHYIGVGPVFTRLALSIMSGMKMSVIVNDQQTMFINVKNGLPQSRMCFISYFVYNSWGTFVCCEKTAKNNGLILKKFIVEKVFFPGVVKRVFVSRMEPSAIEQWNKTPGGFARIFSRKFSRRAEEWKHVIFTRVVFGIDRWAPKEFFRKSVYTVSGALFF